MKHQYTLLCSILGWLGLCPAAQATHLYGGEIQAEVVSCQSFTYKITVVLYAEVDSDVEFSNGVLSLDFGQPINLAEAEDFTYTLQEEGNNLVVGKFEAEYSFPGAGTYLLSYQEFNRSAEVINIPRSVQTPFYIETKLVINSLSCNSPPRLANTLNPVAYAGSRYVLPLRATDPDGDSLTARLVVPYEAAGSEVRGYQLPIDYDLGLLNNPVASDGFSVPTLTVSPEALVWDAPNLGGTFVVNVRVEEWRRIDGEWATLGYVTRDMLIQVLDTVNQTDAQELLVTGTEDAFAAPSLYLYPNPTFGTFSLEINDDTWQGSTATLYNIIGEALDERTVGAGSNRYDVGSYNDGFYFINLRQGELQQTLRFVKR